MRATWPTNAPLVEGALPPAVFTRWIKEVLAKMPGPSAVRALSRNHGMEFVSTVTAPDGGKAPTTLLPLLLCQAGPAKWIATTLPSSSNSVASGTALAQVVPFQV